MNFIKQKLGRQTSGFMIEKDEWIAWREHPITQYVLDTFLFEASANAKLAWVDAAWNSAKLDPVFHASLFERVKVIDEIRTLEYEDIFAEANK